MSAGTTLYIEQRSPEWYAEHVGRVTASRVADAIAKLKRSTEEAAVRRNLRIQMVGEILTGAMAEHYVSKYMQDGIENEPYARAAYEIANDVMCEQVGFVLHPTIERAGCSPDGLVGEDGLLETKCPKVETHIEYILAGKIPEDYEPQMMWQMACTGRRWVDFVSYCGALPEDLQLFVRRLERDEKRIYALELEVNQFLKEVDEAIVRLKEMLA